MSINVDRAPTIFGTVGRSIRQDANTRTDLAFLCLWAFLGLGLTALAIALGFGAQLAEALAMSG
jgi:hypothetical protein